MENWLDEHRGHRSVNCAPYAIGSGDLSRTPAVGDRDAIFVAPTAWRKKSSPSLKPRAEVRSVEGSRSSRAPLGRNDRNVSTGMELPSSPSEFH